MAPAILIAIGLAVLSVQAGWLAWDELFSLLQLWPLLLIVLGADLLLGGRYRLPVAAAAVAVGAAIYLGAFGSMTAGPASTMIVDRPVGSATSARIHLQTGVSDLRVHPGNDPATLIEGTVERGRGERVVEDFRVSGASAIFTLRSEGASFAIPGVVGARRIWDLAVAPNLPIDVRIDTGVGRATVDLTGLELAHLAVATGVGEVSVELPDAGRYETTVETGVGATRIVVPPGVAVRVEASRGLGSVSVRGDVLRNGDVYTSPGYDAASDRVDLRVTSGVGSVSIDVGR